jgi:hypothetical protein
LFPLEEDYVEEMKPTPQQNAKQALDSQAIKELLLEEARRKAMKKAKKSASLRRRSSAAKSDRLSPIAE